MLKRPIIINEPEVSSFIQTARKNGCNTKAIKGLIPPGYCYADPLDPYDEIKEPVVVAWRCIETGDQIDVEYAG